MCRFLSNAKGIEGLHPRPPNSESQEQAKTYTNHGSDRRMPTYFIRGAVQVVAVFVVEIMFEVFVGKVADIFACIFAEDGEGVGRHYGIWIGICFEMRGIFFKEWMCFL